MTQDGSDLEQLALDLIAIPSVIGNEAAIAAYVESWAGARDMHEVVRAGHNLALQPRPFREGVPRLMLLGHLDTVPPADDNVARIEGDRIYGLGATDMKCADALILHLLERAARDEPVTTKGKIPANAVVIPGTRKKQFPAGEYDLPCALIIGERTESTDKKTTLNETLRGFAV